jgi:hypothetical protein
MTKRGLVFVTLLILAFLSLPRAVASVRHQQPSATKHKVRTVALRVVIEYIDPTTASTMLNFELLGSDGLVVGETFPLSDWQTGFTVFEQSFINGYDYRFSNPMSLRKFHIYVGEVRHSLNGRYVSLKDLK